MFGFCRQRHLHRYGLDENYDWRSRASFALPSRSRINSAIYIGTQNRNEQEPKNLIPAVRKAKSADNLRTNIYRQDSEQSAGNNFELPILSVSVVSEKPFVEQYL